MRVRFTGAQYTVKLLLRLFRSKSNIKICRSLLLFVLQSQQLEHLNTIRFTENAYRKQQSPSSYKCIRGITRSRQFEIL